MHSELGYYLITNVFSTCYIIIIVIVIFIIITTGFLII